MFFRAKKSYSNDENLNASVDDDMQNSYSNDDEADYSVLKESDVELIQQLMCGDNSSLQNAVPFHHPKLSEPPTMIDDVLS